MSDWTDGYVADIDYTFGYYTELNPIRVKLAFLNAGLACPEMGTACELGFGQGMSANIHAAASLTSWHGTDFNPSHAGFAQELATVSGSGAKLYDDAFADFAARSDLPDFDYIGLHGIWSWISDDNRAVIVDFIRRKLKVGGLLYISYNTLPGWGAFAPIRHLMTKHAEVFGTDGKGIIDRIDGALEFTNRFIETNPIYLRSNPNIADRMKKIKAQNRNYLAHEYFNRDWHPMYFATMSDWLTPAKISYACSAHYIDYVDSVNLTKEQSAFLKEIPDAVFRESVRDFIINQQFRRDYWVRGARRISALERIDALRAVKVILVSHRPDVSLKINVTLGEATMSGATYDPIFDLLADHKPKTIGQLEQAVKDRGVSLTHVIEAVLVMVNFGHLAAVQDDAVISKAKKQTVKLNSYLINKARYNGEFSHLASPVTGGGIKVDRFQQLFLLAMSLGKKQPVEWAKFASDILDTQNQRIIKNGKALETPEENLQELTIQAQFFADKQLPIMKELQVA